MSKKKPFYQKYYFQNDLFEIIIGGKSNIDSVAAFSIEQDRDIDYLVKSYGYDIENPVEKAEILGNFHEAINFIRKYFLKAENPDGLSLEIPKKIIEIADIRELFYLANTSDTDFVSQTLKEWARSILKVMHTIMQIDKDVRSAYFSDIQKQIFDRFYRLIHRDSHQKLFLGDSAMDPSRVDLIAFQTKPKKSRDSIILKLLHKSENLAEDLFDRVGIRFITHHVLDSVRVIQSLKEKMVILPSHIKPSRSRNTVFNVDHFKDHLDQLLVIAARGELSEEQLIQAIEIEARRSSFHLKNPHSSEFYRAIQFTCRQLIKLQNPLYDDLRELKNLFKTQTMPKELRIVMERIDLKNVQREIQFFYPFEVQVVDAQSAAENEKGRSAHSQYRRAQVFTALTRVMAGLIALGDGKSKKL